MIRCRPAVLTENRRLGLIIIKETEQSQDLLYSRKGECRMIKPWTDIMSKQEMIEYLRVYLKQRGYKKQKQTWHRINQDRVYVIVFRILNGIEKPIILIWERV